MVTDEADCEGIEPRKTLDGMGRWRLRASRQQDLVRYGECKVPPRGLRPCRATHREYAVTREIRQSTFREGRTLGQV